jgi:hypothetical protein
MREINKNIEWEEEYASSEDGTDSNIRKINHKASG